MINIVLHKHLHTLENSGQFSLYNPSFSGHKELYILSYRIFFIISLTLYDTYEVNGVKNRKIRKCYFAHLCYRNDYCI